MPSVSLHLVFVTQMADKDEIICRLHSFQRVISSLCFIIAPSPPPPKFCAYNQPIPFLPGLITGMNRAFIRSQSLNKGRF